MKRPSLAVLLVVLVLWPAAYVLAAPRGQEQQPVIAQPEPDAVVRGVVQVIGSATHPQFQRYELYYAPWPVPSDQSWIFIGPDAHYQQQPLGQLGTWDSRAVPDGTYVLRVRVVKVDGNYIDSAPQRVLVANTRLIVSTPTSTPTVISTPTPIPTPLPPTVTIVVALPTLVTPTAETTVSVQPTVTPLLPVGDASGVDTSVPSISGARLLDVARQSAMYTLGAFGALGVFFGVKAGLAWLWHRIRP